MLSAVVLLASFTLKAMFGLSFRRGIMAFALWQVLCIALGATFLVTILAAASETILTFLLIIALMLLSLWMWSGKQSVGAGEKETGLAKSMHASLGESEKKVVAVAIVALLFSTLVTPSMVVHVYCEPDPDSSDEEIVVETDFTWRNETVRGEIAWSGTVGANVTYQQGMKATGQAPIVEFAQGLLQGGLETAWGIVNVPGALYGLHDFKAATTYLSLINDVTQLQWIMEPQPPLLPQNCKFEPKVESSASTFAKNKALADQLADMGRKEFKVEVASNPDVISKAVDIEKYVDGVAWDSAFSNYFTLNFPLAYETYQKVKAETDSDGEALWQAARIFGLTSPYLELKEAVDSGDPRRMGSSGIKAAFTFVTTLLLLKSAYNMAKGEGLLTAVSKAAYDLVMPAQTLYAILKAGVSKARGAITAIKDVGLKEALTIALDNIASRFRSTEYIEFLDEDVPLLGTQNEPMYDGGALPERTIASTLEESYTEAYIKYIKSLEHDVDVIAIRRFSDRSWERSFIDEVSDYERLNDINVGEAEIQGVKIEVVKGQWGQIITSY